MSNAVTALGLCDGTPAWWALWTDAITRAPPYGDDDGYGPEGQPLAAKCVFAEPWYPQRPEPRPVRPWSAGPLVRWPYRYDPGPAPTDGCGYEDWYDGWRCSGACGG